MKISTLISGFIMLFFLSSCDKFKNESTKKQAIANLIIDVPVNTKLIPEKGIDSYVATLISQDKDTFHIQYGAKGIIYNLYEVSPHVLPLSAKEEIIKQAGRTPTSDDVLFSEYYQEDEGQKIFDKNYFMYDTINGIVLKLVQPKKIGNGMTGIYIPKLKDGNSFSMYAINLDSTANQEALKIFRTIRYK